MVCEQMMKNKVEAALERREIRDFYDIEFMLRKGAAIKASRKDLDFPDNNNMKKIGQVLIGAALITAFVSIIIVTLMPLLAQIQFDSARKLMSRYLWQSVEKKLEIAAKMDPLDSRYPAALGEFIFTQSKYKDNKTPFLKRAAGYYERAIRLNPRCAEYYVKLGQVYVSLAVEEPGTRDQGPGMIYVNKACENFRKAVENDPSGFNTAYAVGYSSLAIWDSLSREARALAIGRLKYALSQKPSYAEYVYPSLLQKTKDITLIASIVPESAMMWWFDKNKIRELKSNPSPAWQGIALDGKSIYTYGNMYWSGTAYRTIELPYGGTVIYVKAKGTPAGGIYPFIFVSLDSHIVGGAYIESAEYKDYSFPVRTDGGVKVLGVTFTNDVAAGGEDRNLYLGEAWVRQR